MSRSLAGPRPESTTRICRRALAGLTLTLLSGVGGLAAPAFTLAQDAAGSKPVVAIIIDDLGAAMAAGERVVALPGPVACAMLPGTPAAVAIARLAHAAGKEILLHQPLEALDRSLDPGPGAITLDMTAQSAIRTLLVNLDELPFVSGVNTHMGSLLTRHPGHMSWLMEALERRPALYFIDSYTTEHSIALQIAREFGVPSVKRDVFLDTDPAAGAVAAEFERLIGLARKRGAALAIGHPYPDTMAFLERELPALAARGIDLVPVSQLIARPLGADIAWPRSSYQSPKASRSSKPSL